MAFNDLNTIAYSVLPSMRAAEVISAEIASLPSNDATAAAKAQTAKAELHVRWGDDYFRARQYQKSLDEFKIARGLIYKILYPGFDVTSMVLTRKDTLLPVSAVLEKTLIQASAQLADSIRPVTPDPPPVIAITREPIAQHLQMFTKTEFREPQAGSDELQAVNHQAVSLLSNSKPEAAVSLLTRALASDGQSEPSLVGATHLNLAAAYVQSNDHRAAIQAAERALRVFTETNDVVGQAQALHMAGVGAQKAGDAERARGFLTRAQETLKSAQGTTRVGPEERGGVLDRPVSGSVAAVAVRARIAALEGVRTLAAARSRDLTDLQAITQMDTQKVTYRVPGRDEGWGAVALEDAQLRQQQSKPWNIGISAGEAVIEISAAAGQIPAADAITNNLYQARVDAQTFRQLDFAIVGAASTTFYLTHFYAYALPLKIGDCYNELGQFSKAEEYYLMAAGYTYLNRTVEASVLWIRIARNAVEWGDALYKNEDIQAAKAQYNKLITDAAGVPSPSVLFETTSLVNPANEARTLIQNLGTRPLPAVNWDIAYYVLTASSRVQQILAGLDFYGLLLSPIHTFEYLQSVARSFAQQAIQAEREFVNFKNHQELEEATRRELETMKAMAEAEANARWEQYQAAIEDESAATKAVQLATKRRDDAVAQRAAYASSSLSQIWGQAASAALSGGEDAYWSEISELADRLARGETISGPGPKLAAAQILYAGRKTREYELKKMQDTIDELTQAIGVAQDQFDAATRRKNAAEIAWQAAVQRSQMADASLDAFDSEFFTPESWEKMASIMRDISRSYLYNAIRIAKLMERAYNFENDTDLHIIKSQYGYNVGNPAAGDDTRLLGGDGLLRDIDGFTYMAITSKTRKNSRVKDVISAAANFPAQFEQFRNTGLLSVETDLYEFDRLHPGFYGQRIEGVEIQIVGLLPEGGLNGTLTAGGVTRYRRKDGTTGARVHQVDTMAVSNFTLRNDMFLYSAETGVRGLFQGIGLGSTWQLHLPKRSNDFDFRRIFDVQIVIYYTALYDSVLRSNMLALPPRPGELSLRRDFGLRYDFPDAWYAFYRSGLAEFHFDRFRLPMNQQNFQVENAFLRVITKAGVSNAGVELNITGPNNASGTVTTDANGVVSTENAALAGLIGADPVGQWRVAVTNGAALMDGGALKFDRVYNIQFGLDYGFEYVPEEL